MSIAIIATTVMEVVLLAALFGRTSSSDLVTLIQLVLLAVLAAPGVVLLQSSLALRGQAGDRRRLITGINKLRTYFVIIAVLAGLLLLQTAARTRPHRGPAVRRRRLEALQRPLFLSGSAAWAGIRAQHGHQVLGLLLQREGVA